MRASTYEQTPAYLKQRRRDLDLTQEELAARVGCSLVMLQKIEQGTRRPSKHLASLLAACLEIPDVEHVHFIRLVRKCRDVIR